MGRFIVRGTDTKVTITNSNQQLDLRLLGTPKVSIVQDHREMYITGATVAEHTVTFDLTQAQTLSLDAGKNNKTCEVQCHFMKNGKRTESFIVPVPVYNTLHNEVIQ